jgi:signal peptidase I
LILNEKAVKEPYVKHVTTYSDTYRDNFPVRAGTPLRPSAMEMLDRYVVNGELVVPPGYLFAMGDNRDDSDDSRYWGLVPRENIVGTPVIIYWSYDASTQDLTNGNIGFDHIIDVLTHFPTKTRWRRTLNPIRGYPLQ